ncbi:MAG TPA: glycosyltransferase family 1 protein, partial [Candidatus Pacebacteria bacterium]|nr:glycosyltransferase family 1 protein [Candidatus Paceibacterota bacterium]
MKIGIDARFYGPGSKGLGRYTQKLITHLEDIDHENEYVIFLREDNFEEYIPKNKNFVRVKANYRWYSFSEQIFFPLVLYKQRCDLVHFPHFNVPVLYFRKFIVTIHDLILLHYPTRKASTRSRFFYWMKYIVYRGVIASVVKRTQKIIAVSEFTAGDICDKYPYVCDKVVVIYEAAEIDVQSETDDAENLQKYDIIEPYMLYVGNAYPHKNLNVLVEAFARYLHNGGTVGNLILVGCDDYFYKKLQTYISKEKLRNVRMLYTVDDVLLMTLYRRASFFVFPSLYEGFGLPPLEAQLLGVPVLSSDYACMTEVLSESG